MFVFCSRCRRTEAHKVNPRRVEANGGQVPGRDPGAPVLIIACEVRLIQFPGPGKGVSGSKPAQLKMVCLTYMYVV